MKQADPTTTESNSEYAVFINRFRQITGDTDSFLQLAAVEDRAAEVAFRLVLEQRQESGSVSTITDLIERLKT